MKSSIYREPKSFSKYNDSEYIVYLNEEIIENYVPTNVEPDAVIEPYTAYKYTGTLSDGGTLINCKNATRNDLINGIIRTRFSQTEEDAIKTHQIEVLKDTLSDDKKDEYNTEWSDFNDFRVSIISLVDKWLN